MTSSGFLEDKIDAPSVASQRNRFWLSLIPYEQTTTYGRGTRGGPDAIVEASGHIELLDETLRVDASRHGIITVRPEITDLASVVTHAASVAETSSSALLGFFGGEHSITPAIIEGLGRRDVGIVWIDAHADLRQTYNGRPDNHACAGHNCLPFGHLVQIGVRSLAHEEAELLKSSDRVRAFPAWDRAARDAVLELPEDVYVSIDLDGLTPSLMRAVGTPEPGGLQWQEVLSILDVVMSHKNVYAFDVVELCPQPDDIVSSFTAARLAYKVLQYYTYHQLR